MKRSFFIRGGVFAVTIAMVLSGCSQAAPTKSPEEMLKDGMSKLRTVTSHEFEIALNADITGPKGETPAKVKFNAVLGGALDVKNPKDPKINLKLDGSGDSDGAPGSAGFELRLDKDNMYFDLAKLDIKDGKAGKSLVPPELVGYVGKWFSLPIPPGSLDELTAALPNGGGSQETLTPAQQKMKDLFEKTQFFKNIKFVGVDDVKGEQSFHYTADVDTAALETVIMTVAADNGQPMTAEQKQKMHESMAKFNFVGNVWVGKDSGVLNQVSGDIKLPVSDSDPSGTISVRVTLWNLNKPVTVTVPKDATEFPLKGMMGGLMGGAAGAGADVTAGIDGADLNLDATVP